MELAIAFVVAAVRFALDPIGWLAIAAGAVVGLRQRARWPLVFLAAAALTMVNVLLVNTARHDLGLGSIPLARVVVIFAALSALGFAGYSIPVLVGRLHARNERPPNTERTE